MSIQSSLDVNTVSPFLSGSFKGKAGTFLQDSGRTIPLARMTVLGKVAASGGYVPLDATASDGRQYPSGIYNGLGVAAADIVAGDVELMEIVIGGDGKIIEEELIFENSETLATVIDGEGRTVQDYLNDKGLFFRSVTDADEFQA